MGEIDVPWPWVLRIAGGALRVAWAVPILKDLWINEAEQLPVTGPGDSRPLG